MDHRRRGLFAGTMLLGIGSASVPMAGCEPVSVSTGVAVATITLQHLLQWILKAAVTYTVYKFGDAIYVEIVDALNGESTNYQVELEPGDVLEVLPDGTFVVH